MRKSPNSKTDSDWSPRIIGCRLIRQDLVVMFMRACKKLHRNKQLWQWLFAPAVFGTLIILLPTEATEGRLHVLGNIPQISRRNQQKLCLEMFLIGLFHYVKFSPHAVTMWEMSEVYEVFPRGVRLGMYAGCHRVHGLHQLPNCVIDNWGVNWQLRHTLTTIKRHKSMTFSRRWRSNARQKFSPAIFFHQRFFSPIIVGKLIFFAPNLLFLRILRQCRTFFAWYICKI